jgi:hypothetical protein
MAKRKRPYVYEEDEDFDVGKYTRQNMAAASANVSAYRKERPQTRLSQQAMYRKSENRQSSHTPRECTISLGIVKQHDRHVEGDMSMLIKCREDGKEVKTPPFQHPLEPRSKKHTDSVYAGHSHGSRHSSKRIHRQKKGQC